MNNLVFLSKFFSYLANFFITRFIIIRAITNITTIDITRRLSHPVFQRTKPGSSYVCLESPHICQNEKISETMLLYNVYIAILTLTLEYRGTVAKLLLGLHSSQGRLTGGSICQALLKRLLKTSLHLYYSSKQHLTTHFQCGGNSKSESMSR
jgi:hypothetical protein